MSRDGDVPRDMSHRAGAATVLALTAALACEAAPAQAPDWSGPDKRTLYGDPALVPTRAGERAREELALAGSVIAALRARAGQGALAVEVRLPGAADPGAAVVTGELALAAEDVVRIAEGVLGPWSAGRVQVELAPARADASDRAAEPPWALALALLGLGVAAGVSIERLRRRRG